MPTRPKCPPFNGLFSDTKNSKCNYVIIAQRRRYAEAVANGLQCCEDLASPGFELQTSYIWGTHANLLAIKVVCYHANAFRKWYFACHSNWCITW